MAIITDNLFIELMYNETTVKEIAKKTKCSRMSVYRKRNEFLKRWNYDEGNLVCINCKKTEKCSVHSTQGNRAVSSITRCIYKKFHNLNSLPENAIIVHVNGDKEDNRPSNLYMLPCREMATSFIVYKRRNNLESLHPHEYMKIRGNYLMETVFNPYWLYQKYIVEELSMKAIAAMYGMSPSTISRGLYRHTSPNNPKMKLIDCREKYKNGTDAYKIPDNQITIDRYR